MYNDDYVNPQDYAPIHIIWDDYDKCGLCYMDRETGDLCQIAKGNDAVEWYNVKGQWFTSSRAAFDKAQKIAQSTKRPVNVWRYLAVGEVDRVVYPKRETLNADER